MPGAPLSLAPASSPAAWKALTRSRSKLAKAMCCPTGATQSASAAPAPLAAPIQKPGSVDPEGP